MLSLPFIFLTLLACLLLRHLKNLWELKHFPPGHPRLPVVGSLFFLTSEIVKDAEKLLPKYGSVIGYVLGAER